MDTNSVIYFILILVNKTQKDGLFVDLIITVHKQSVGHYKISLRYYSTDNSKPLDDYEMKCG